MVDVGYGWEDWREALAVIESWTPYDVFFVETPLWTDDIDGYAELARRSPIPIAAGEWLATHHEFAEYTERGALHVLQPDVGRVGGLTEALRVCALAAEHGLPVIPHGWKTGITVAATAHLAAVTPHLPFFEFVPAEAAESRLRRELTVDELVLQSDGVLAAARASRSRHRAQPRRARGVQGSGFEPGAGVTTLDPAPRVPGSAPDVNGYVAPGFERVRAAFEANFRLRDELGAAFAVYRDGEPVVDLWGGTAERATGRPWQEDSLQLIFSGTKGLVATCVLILLDRGALALDDPVARHWPEFAAAGKADVRVRDLVAHTARLPGLEQEVSVDEILDDRRMAALLAAQAQSDDPRAAGCYHPLTFGWLVGELVRRTDGRSVGRFFAEEVAQPLGLELWIGLPGEHASRVTTIEPDPAVQADDPDPLSRQIWANPPDLGARGVRFQPARSPRLRDAGRQRHRHRTLGGAALRLPRRRRHARWRAHPLSGRHRARAAAALRRGASRSAMSSRVRGRLPAPDVRGRVRAGGGGVRSHGRGRLGPRRLARARHRLLVCDEPHAQRCQRRARRRAPRCPRDDDRAVNEPRRLRLGLAQGLVPVNPDDLTPALAAEIAVLGVTRIVTHFEVPPGELAGARGEEIAALLREAGLGVAQCAGVTPNLVSPDRAVRMEGVALLAELMRSAQALGAQMVLSGCGSHHPTFSYGPSRENHTPAARGRLVESLRELGLRAGEAGMPAAVEVHVLTTLDTPEHVRDVLDEVDSPWVLANYDPVNFLGSLDAVYDSGARARHAAATIGPRLAPSAHIKDVVVEPDLVLKIAEAPPGTGIMDLDAVIESCRHLPEDSTLVVEHFGPEESAAALRVVADLAGKHGMLER